jgi:branched-chain amino acid transport system substrate-binding protein
LRAKAPKAVFLAGLDNELGLIVRQSREVEFSPQFFATAGAISQKLLEVAGSAAEGLICGSAPFDLQSKDPHVESFSNSYEKRYDENPDFIAANSYDAIYIVAELFKNGATNGETIRDGLYKTTNFHGVGGLTTFDHYGEVNKPINLVIVKNGEFKELEDR